MADKLDVALAAVRRTMDEHGMSSAAVLSAPEVGTIYVLHFAPGGLFEAQSGTEVAMCIPDGEAEALAVYVQNHLQMLRGVLSGLAGLHLSCSQLEAEALKLLRTSPALAELGQQEPPAR